MIVRNVDVQDGFCNIGITHVFSALTFAGCRESCLNTRLLMQ